MTLAQKVAAEIRSAIVHIDHAIGYGAAEAIADVVEAGENAAKYAQLDGDGYSWPNALAKLAKAVGVEGE